MGPRLILCFLCSFAFAAGGISQESTGLLTRSYQGSATSIEGFRQRYTEGYSPFTESSQKDLISLRGAFEKLGVRFGNNASVQFDEKSGVLTVTNTSQQVFLIEAFLNQLDSANTHSLQLSVEAIEVGKREWHEWIVENPIELNRRRTREVLHEWLRDGRAKLVRNATLVTRSGERAKLRSGSVYTYPNGYSSTKQSEALLPTSPASLKSRNLGLTLEADLVVGADRETIDINIVIEEVEMSGFSEWPNQEIDPKKQIRMPTFYTQNLTTQATSKGGDSILLASSAPRKTVPDPEDTLWLWFARVDILRPYRWTILGSNAPLATNPHGLLELDNGLYQKIYLIVPGFIGGPEKEEFRKLEDPFSPENIVESRTVPDPFGLEPPRGPDSPVVTTTPPPLKRPSARSILEQEGITFPEGGMAFHVPRTSQLVVQTTKEELLKVDQYLDSTPNSPERHPYVMTEFIEVEKSDYTEWLYENRIHRDGTELHSAVLDWIDDGRGHLLDLSVVLVRSGQRAKTQSVTEFPFPAEISPNGRADAVEARGKSEAEPATINRVSEWESRELGTELEVDLVIGADGETLDLFVSPEIDQLESYTPWPSLEAPPEQRVDIPAFHEMRLSTQVTQRSGRYGLLGTAIPMEARFGMDDPIVLIFLRADIDPLE